MSGGRYNRRFGLIYLLLAAIAGAAVSVGLLLAVDSDSEGGTTVSGQQWSAWQPAAGAAAIPDIASYVAGRYRLPSGNQMVLVSGNLPGVSQQVGSTSAPSVARAPIMSFAVPTEQDGQTVYVIDNGVTIEYQMCGLGRDCAIPAKEGKASTERGLVLQRAVLELALYTFHYVPEVDSVVVLYPPPLGEKPKFAFFLSRDDLSGPLSAPIDATLSPAAPTVGEMPAGEVQLVSRLTTPHAFGFRYTLQPDGTAQMVLIPPGTTQRTLGESSGG